MEKQKKTMGKTIKTETKDYDEYVFAWGNYISGLNPLLFVADKQLSQEVMETKQKLYDLMIKVAKVKFPDQVRKCIDCGETERRVLTESRGKGVWSCWDCDNRDMQEEESRAIASGNHGSCFE
jgi:hypothetical protein